MPAPPRAANPPWQTPYGPPYVERAEVQAFIAQVAGTDKAYATRLGGAFANVPQRLHTDPNAPPSGEDLAFDTYMAIFAKPDDVPRGVKFAQDHSATLELARERYGVDPQIILGILQVETRYGTHTDTVPVLNALVQRAFDSNRTAYFKGELTSFLEQAKTNHWNLTTFKGSSAGAFGMPQFMPSNVPRYGVSAHPPAAPNVFDADDAILCVGNFLRQAPHQPWRTGQPAAVQLAGNVARLTDKQAISVGALRSHGFSLPAALGDDVKGTIFRYTPSTGGPDRAMFLPPNNKVVQAYNNSRTYAAATYLLGQQIYDAWRATNRQQ
jgi:membrane-bound lytic murein transglycosylase B